MMQPLEDQANDAQADGSTPVRSVRYDFGSDLSRQRQPLW